MVEEWTPEPLVQPQTAFEKEEAEKLPVIVGYVQVLLVGYEGEGTQERLY